MSDDIVLIERARRDPEAFTSLYQQYLSAVYRYLYHRVGNSNDAEDITAQVFLEVLEGLRKNRYRKGGNFRAWLFTIARRRAIDFYRAASVCSLPDSLPSSEPALFVSVEQREELQFLVTALSQLDEEKREILRLRYTAGLSFAEIALLLGKNEPAVKMMAHRAIDLLRQVWEAKNG